MITGQINREKTRMERYIGIATLRKSGARGLSGTTHSGPLQSAPTFLTPQADVCLRFYPGVALMLQTRADEKKILTSAELLHDSLGR